MNKSLPFLFALVLSTPLMAETTSLEKMDKKLDVIEQKVDLVQEKSNQIYDKVENNPLGNKRFGVELNVFRVLLIDKGEYALSGGFSYFDTKNNREIAFPVFTSSDKETFSGHIDKYRFTSLDVHYRQYLGDTLNGFYLSGFTRATQIQGTLGEDDYFNLYEYSQPGVQASEFKMGIGVGLGYRIISKSGLYWGCGLMLGRYFIGDSDIFRDGDGIDEDSEIILDMDLLKFGYAF